MKMLNLLNRALSFKKPSIITIHGQKLKLNIFKIDLRTQRIKELLHLKMYIKLPIDKIITPNFKFKEKL